MRPIINCNQHRQGIITTIDSTHPDDKRGRRSPVQEHLQGILRWLFANCIGFLTLVYSSEDDVVDNLRPPRVKQGTRAERKEDSGRGIAAVESIVETVETGNSLGVIRKLGAAESTDSQLKDDLMRCPSSDVGAGAA
jgi:hypothetical protein